jgi:TetR/AcrR family transcriptional regulator, copper-responsive repressor
MNAGRKRAFDKTEALDKAMRVFWENGYAGTSMSDLTAALGINKPSLYAAFGNKEQLFEAAMQHYMAHYGTPLQQRLTTPPDTPLPERLRCYLHGIIDLVTDKESPKGCLFVKSSCESGGAALPEEINRSLQEMGLASERFLLERLESEQRHGQLPGNARLQDLAAYLMSVIYGLSVMARRGKTKPELEAVVETAIRALPSNDL